MPLTIYGIPNCDTMKKARSWLDAANVAYQFHDYKKSGADAADLQRWCKALGWEKVLNRAGTTFRKLINQKYPDLEIRHFHHAGNSSGVVDGAAAVLVASADYARQHGLKPRARIVATVNMGDDPTLMLNAPVPAANGREVCAASVSKRFQPLACAVMNSTSASVAKTMLDLNISHPPRRHHHHPNRFPASAWFRTGCVCNALESGKTPGRSAATRNSTTPAN